MDFYLPHRLIKIDGTARDHIQHGLQALLLKSSQLYLSARPSILLAGATLDFELDEELKHGVEMNDALSFTYSRIPSVPELRRTSHLLSAS
jgi:hypothetical protein